MQRKNVLTRIAIVVLVLSGAITVSSVILLCLWLCVGTGPIGSLFGQIIINLFYCLPIELGVALVFAAIGRAQYKDKRSKIVFRIALILFVLSCLILIAGFLSGLLGACPRFTIEIVLDLLPGLPATL